MDLQKIENTINENFEILNNSFNEFCKRYKK